MFMDLCHLHFMLKKWSLHFCYTFLYSSSSWHEAEPGEARFGKSWLHEPLPGASVQHEIKKEMPRFDCRNFPPNVLDEDVPDSLFRPNIWPNSDMCFFPFGGWMEKMPSDYSNPSSQLHGKRTVPFLVVFCHPFEKICCIELGFFHDVRTKDYKDIQPFEGTLMVACILALSWSSTSMSSMQCCLTHKVSNWISWLVVQQFLMFQGLSKLRRPPFVADKSYVSAQSNALMFLMYSQKMGNKKNTDKPAPALPSKKRKRKETNKTLKTKNLFSIFFCLGVGVGSIQ